MPETNTKFLPYQEILDLASRTAEVEQRNAVLLNTVRTYTQQADNLVEYLRESCNEGRIDNTEAIEICEIFGREFTNTIYGTVTISFAAELTGVYNPSDLAQNIDYLFVVNPNFDSNVDVEIQDVQYREDDQ